MKQGLCLFILTLVVATPCRADLYSALHHVYETNPIIEQSRAAADAACAGVDASASAARPYLGLAGSAGMARTDALHHRYDYVPTQIGIEFQQNVFQGFGIISQIRSARFAASAATAMVYVTTQDIFLNTINAYVSVMNAADVLDLTQNNERVLREYYDYCRDLQRVGKLTKTDVAQASARLEMARYAVADANAKYENARETFRRIYGDLNVGFTQIDLSRTEILFPESIDDATEYAVQNHPILRALDARYDAARQNINVARKSILPSVDVRASAVQADDLPYLDRVRDARVGVYMKLPLYDKGAAFAETERARYMASEIDDQIIDTRRKIIENLRQAWNNYAAQGAAIRAANAGVDANEMALRGTRAEQKSGRRTVLDVLNAEQELLNTRVSLSQAKYSRIAAYFAILGAMGKLNPQNLGFTDIDSDDE